MNITATIDMKSFERAMAGWTNDLAYVTSRALNDTLKDSQKTMVESINRDFTIRRPGFVQRSVKIDKFSTKTDLEGHVGIADIGGKRTADILSKFERGGTKTARRMIAVPTPFARPSQFRLIPKNKRPRNLSNAVKVKTKAGNELLLVRLGRGKKRRTEIAYWLKPSVKVDNRLHFVDKVTATINQRFNANFTKRFAEVRSQTR